MSVVSLLRGLGRYMGRTHPGRRGQDGEPPCPVGLLIGGTSPLPADAARIAAFLSSHSCWSVFWDKRHGVWRAAEDDPGSLLYTEDADVDAVMSYITAHA